MISTGLRIDRQGVLNGAENCTGSTRLRKRAQICIVLIGLTLTAFSAPGHAGQPALIGDAEVRANSPTTPFGMRNSLSVREAQLQNHC